jgi:hypothetical protein
MIPVIPWRNRRETFTLHHSELIPVIPFSWSMEVVGVVTGNRPEVENVLETCINTGYYHYV